MTARARAAPRSRERAGDAPRAAGAGDPLALALTAALAATLLLRATATLLPGRWLWGADLGRDLPPAWFLGTWLLAALALVPSCSRPLARLLPAGARGTAVLGAVLALAMGLLAWRFPEQLYFTGDTWLRKPGFAGTPHPLAIVPQAMPGDLALHWWLPRWLEQHAHAPSSFTGRVWGAGLAMIQGLLAWDFARRRGLRGGAALAAIALCAWTANLALFNGYSKALVELAVLQTAAVSALLASRKSARGTLVMGVVVAAAIVLHRMGLLLLPAWMLALHGSARREGGRGWREPAWIAGALIPLAVLALLAPRLTATLGGFDLVHHAAIATGGGVAHAFSPARLADLLNLLLLLVPALPLLLALPFTLRRGNAAGEGAAFAALIVPQAVLLLVTEPQHGVFRDWDVYTCLGALVALWLAAAIGDRVARAPRSAWLAIPVLLVSAAPATLWLAHQSDLERGYARVRSVLEGPPTRGSMERASGFDQLSLVLLAHQQGDRAAEACSLSVAIAPNPRVYVQWGMAETFRQRPAAALERYLAATRLQPGWRMAWQGVAAASSALGDREHMQQAVNALRVLAPDDALTRDAEQWLQTNRPAPRSQ